MTGDEFRHRFATNSPVRIITRSVRFRLRWIAGIAGITGDGTLFDFRQVVQQHQTVSVERLLLGYQFERFNR